MLVVMALALLVCGVGTAATAEPDPLGFRELTAFKGWAIAEHTQETAADAVVFYKNLDIRIVLDPSQSIESKQMSAPPGCSAVYELRRQGDILLALAGSDSGRILAWRSIKTAGAKWVVSPPFTPIKSSPASLAIDPQGRMVTGGRRSGDIFYQKEPGGPVQAFTFPLRGQGKSINRVQTIVGPGGIIWLFEALIGGATNYKGLEGALRFKDGAITHHKLGINAHVATAVPVSAETIFVGVYAKPGLFMDARNGTVKGEGPFDLSAFRDHAVSRWSRAKDGTLWMVTFSHYYSAQNKEEKARNLFGQVWKWDGKELTLVKDGYDRKKAFTAKANPVVGLSEDRVLAGCSSGGLFYADKTTSEWVDWRHGLPADDVFHIHSGDAFILLTDSQKRHFIATTSDPSKIPATTDASLPLLRTVADIETDANGRAWTILPGQPATLAMWGTDQWQKVAPVPHTPDEIWGFAFDSKNRPWIYGNHRTPKVWVLDGDTWTTYETKSQAYQKESENHDWQLGINFMQSYARSKPLIVKKGEIWHICEWARIHILRNGTWWSGYHEKCGNGGSWGAAPYRGSDGEGRVVQGNKVMRFTGDDLTAVQEEIQKPKPQQLTTECGKRPELAGVPLKCAVRDVGSGITWAAATGARLFGIKGETVKEYSLAHSPAVSRSISRIVAASGGTVFLRVGGTHPTRDWIAFSPDIPRITFSATAKGGPNQIEVTLSDLSIPRDKLSIRVRVDSGPWQDTTRLAPVREGDHIVQIACELKDGLSSCVPLSKQATVTGDLDSALGALVQKLGARTYKDRKQAIRDLLAAGAVAIPYLERAATDADPEIGTNAQEILERLQKQDKRSGGAQGGL
ncbi:MAG: hypothetical protein HN919_19420 [Verrucomicrobia bacterium]|nr:hypothetical protein [Verrucomicrobiota bacterium]MBT7068473.1 hypothetical protein [Verrucomicrobiota bacterium]